MCCPLCLQAAHARKINHLDDGSKEVIHQCQNVECSATFATKEIFNHVIENSKIKVSPKTER
ncbi:ogr/Delta-like zinc finger family protein [Yersinia ruckeri]|nr:ogr/Delta-like zinc finger family protein [Yersinia ruckeri]MCW6542995.1 ogr/Delta-like zinc finger family protein [Yersinia ruckeri]MCW6591423.1 ogr/Delta-like zinc finger family protein [Yersinia ruckeri]UZX93329.1 ogr/Delta-like zinc finger family protein [Yersinia ruckeri]